MKYATWKLNFTDPNYGTGPEPSIVEQGNSAEGSIAEGDITKGARILGYFTGEPTGLEVWSFNELTQQEALDFVLAFDDTAYVAEDGRIVVVIDLYPAVEQ
jgi:hypothetical protein